METRLSMPRVWPLCVVEERLKEERAREGRLVRAGLRMGSQDWGY